MSQNSLENIRAGGVFIFIKLQAEAIHAFSKLACTRNEEHFALKVTVFSKGLMYSTRRV